MLKRNVLFAGLKSKGGFMFRDGTMSTSNINKISEKLKQSFANQQMETLVFKK